LNNATGLDPLTGQTEQNIPRSHYTGDYLSDPDTDEPLNLPSYFLDLKQPAPGVYLSILKILCGANAFQINDIQEHEMGLARRAIAM
jgi:hypothetical protein